MNWRDQTIARRVQGVVRVLDEGVPIQVAFDDLTSNGAPTRLMIQTRVVASDTDADRALIGEIMGDSQSLSGMQLCRRLVELSRPAIRRIVESIDAQNGPDESAVKSIRQALSGAAFSCGFILTDPFVVDLMVRKIAPAFTARPLPAPADSKTICVVGGNALVEFDAATGRELKRISIDPSIGPARSINTMRANDSRQILIGAKNGAALIDRDGSCSVIAQFADGHSINSIVQIDQSKWMTTSKDGLTGWKDGEPTRLDQHPARFALRVADHVVFASGPTLRVIDPDGTIDTIGGGAEIIQIFVEDESCIVVRTDGTIETVDVVEGRVLDVRHVGTCRAASICFGFADGFFALVRPDGSIEMKSVTGPLSARFRGFTGCRSVSSRDGWIVGVSEDSTKLPIWRADSPHEPVRVIEATHLIGHRVADVLVE